MSTYYLSHDGRMHETWRPHVISSRKNRILLNGKVSFGFSSSYQAVYSTAYISLMLSKTNCGRKATLKASQPFKSHVTSSYVIWWRCNNGIGIVRAVDDEQSSSFRIVKNDFGLERASLFIMLTLLRRTYHCDAVITFRPSVLIADIQWQILFGYWWCNSRHCVHSIHRYFIQMCSPTEKYVCPSSTKTKIGDRPSL